MQPYFVGFDTKQREEFLSQHGNFSSGERDAFHKICRNWQEQIPYNRFLMLINRGDGATTGDLQNLLSKLRKNGYGLLRTSVNDGRRGNEAIVVTDQFDPRFVSELVNEYFNDLLESITNPLPLLSSVRKEFNDFPTSALTFVSSDELAQEFSTRDAPETALAIQTIGGDRLLVTREKLYPFITVSMLKLRYYLGNTSILELLAKLLDTSLIALKQKIAGREPSIWLSVTKMIVDRRKEIDTLRTVSVDPDFYHTAWLLRRLLVSQIAEAEQKKRDAEDRRIDLGTIATAIKEAPDGWMEQVQLLHFLERFKEKYGDAFESLETEFYQRYVQPHGKNGLPKIVSIDGRYIHRERIFPLFLAHFRSAEINLKRTFVARMEEQLRNGNAGGDTTFVDLDNFDAAILDEIKRFDPLLGSLIGRPNILAAGMIHHAKQNKLVKDVSALKQHLAVYFDPKTMKPLPLHEWFNLRLVEILEVAFERLPILKRIWIRLAGKYESFRSRYVGKSAIKQQERHRLPASTRSEWNDTGLYDGPRPSGKSASWYTRGRGRGEDTRRRRSTTRSRTSVVEDKMKDGSPMKRAYTKKQVDSAWQEFGSSIKKMD